jgi:peptide/nickel transport system permease protein
MTGAVEKLEAGGAVPEDRAAGLGPYTLARRRLLRNRTAMVSLVVFLLVVVACLSAPLYADHVAHVNPFESNVSGTTIVNGKEVPVLQEGGGALGLGTTPIGPTWDFHHYFLGADGQGRDVMARLLYGGRNSLLIGAASALICCVLATIIAIIAGFFGGLTDGVLSRLMDVVWAFPVYLLAISISIVALTNGLDLGIVTLGASSLWLPIGIIAIIYIPYVARPVRGQVLSVREKEYVEAAIAQGASDWRLMRSEILPNVITTVIVFFPLMIATTMLTEAALSFLSLGVQAPDASWGTIINDGQNVLYTRPWVAISPGIAIVIVVLTLNVFGDGLRDALDPRAKLRTRA